MSLELRVPARPSSLGTVRRAIYSLRSQMPSETVDNLALIYSELMTNAIRHAELNDEAALEVALSVDGSKICGRVSDPGVGFTQPETLPTPTDHGWGLRIVDQLSTRWGVRHNNGNEVWFEM